VLRDDVWETFDILDRARNLYRGLKITGTVVTNGNGLVLAAADPRSTPSYSSVPATVTSRFATNDNLWLDDVGKVAAARRSLVYNGLNVGAIYAQFDVSALFREREDGNRPNDGDVSSKGSIGRPKKTPSRTAITTTKRAVNS
jgi:two-component system, OmpR family, sensor kinase